MVTTLGVEVRYERILSTVHTELAALIDEMLDAHIAPSIGFGASTEKR